MIHASSRRMPAGMSAPEAARKMVVLSPNMSSQMRCASASWRAPKPVPSIFSKRPATERSRSTCTGRVGAVRYFEGRGLRCVTIFVITLNSVESLESPESLESLGNQKQVSFDSLDSLDSLNSRLFLSPFTTFLLLTVHREIGVGADA